MLEPIVLLILAGKLQAIEVYGAPSCKVATDYAIYALQKPSLSQSGESYNRKQIKPINCSYTYNGKITIRMTHLDGWHYNIAKVNNPFL